MSNDDKMRYVDITTKGCEGWLNLIIGDYCIAMIKPPVADMVRKALTQQPESEPPCEKCGFSSAAHKDHSIEFDVDQYPCSDYTGPQPTPQVPEYPVALLRRMDSFLTDAEKAPDFLSPNRVGPVLADVRQALKFAPSIEERREPHQWDDSGERCTKCGEKDWFASPGCEPPATGVGQ